MTMARIGYIEQPCLRESAAEGNKSRSTNPRTVPKKGLRGFSDRLLRDIGVIDGHEKNDPPQPAACARDLIDRYR